MIRSFLIFSLHKLGRTAKDQNKVIKRLFTLHAKWGPSGSQPIGYEFHPGSWQLLGERRSALSLTITELYGL